MNRWQFSTRSLLVLTAIASIVLAIAVNMPLVFQVVLIAAAPILLIAAILQSANFATSDRRPRLAVVTWCLLGAFFAVFIFALLNLLMQDDHRLGVGLPFWIMVMMACCITCIYQACRSFTRIGRTEPADSTRTRLPSVGEPAPGREQ